MHEVSNSNENSRFFESNKGSAKFICPGVYPAFFGVFKRFLAVSAVFDRLFFSFLFNLKLKT